MQPLGIIQDLAIVLLIAGLVALLCQILRQPRIVGYIVAGVIIGPNTPPFVLIQDQASIKALAELGMLFLMFSLGLDFSLRRLLRVGVSAVLIALVDVTVMLWLGYQLGRWMGWGTIESLFLGAIVCDSSTAVLGRVVQEIGAGRERFTGIVVGITVVEDLLTVVLIAVLNGLALTGSMEAGDVVRQLGQMGTFLVVLTVGGILTVPRFLNFLGRFRSDELLLVVLVGLCFGVTIIAARLQMSMALGALLVGALASEARSIQKVETLVAPLRHVFSAVFFVSVGLMLDPRFVVENLPIIILVAGVVMAGKFINGTMGTLFSGHDMPSSLCVGASLAQVCEFAFIIAALGLTLGATRVEVYQIGVSAAVLTTFLSPYGLRLVYRHGDRLAESALLGRWSAGFRVYSQWMERIRSGESGRAVRRVVWRSVVVVGINLALVAGIFAGAGFLARHYREVLAALPFPPGAIKGGMWLGCSLISLPLYITAIRKLEALSMVIAELSVPMGLRYAWAQSVRQMVGRTVWAAALMGVGMLTLIFSSAILPPVNVMVFLLPVLAVFTWWNWRRLMRIYYRAEGAIRAVLEEPETGSAGGGGHPQRADLFNMELTSVDVKDPPAPGGAVMRMTDLHERTGVVVVGVERNGRQMSNPEPGMEFRVGDRLLLMGEPEEIEEALVFLGLRKAAGLRQGGPGKSGASDGI